MQYSSCKNNETPKGINFTTNKQNLSLLKIQSIPLHLTPTKKNSIKIKIS